METDTERPPHWTGFPESRLWILSKISFSFEPGDGRARVSYETQLRTSRFSPMTAAGRRALHTAGGAAALHECRASGQNTDAERCTTIKHASWRLRKAHGTHRMLLPGSSLSGKELIL